MIKLFNACAASPKVTGSIQSPARNKKKEEKLTTVISRQKIENSALRGSLLGVRNLC